MKQLGKLLHQDGSKEEQHLTLPSSFCRLTVLKQMRLRKIPSGIIGHMMNAEAFCNGTMCTGARLSLAQHRLRVVQFL